VSGRRLRNAVKTILVEGGAIPADSFVVIAGLSGTYADYITTYEEYQAQRYEAASTIYGPHTLSGFIQEFSRLAQSLIANTTLPPGPLPPDFTGRQLSFVPKPKQDTVPDGSKFGDAIVNPEPSYKVGEVPRAVFWAGNPRNELLLESSYMFVERNEGGRWLPVRFDGNWDTEFIWEDLSGPLEPSQSTAELKWYTDKNSVPGEYRFRYQGHSRDADDIISPFTGISSTFVLEL